MTFKELQDTLRDKIILARGEVQRKEEILRVSTRFMTRNDAEATEKVLTFWKGRLYALDDLQRLLEKG